MDDEAHVRLVDPHAEGDGRDDHPLIGLEEPGQPVLALPGVQPRVIGDRIMAGCGQGLGQPLAALPRSAIDDARYAASRLDQFGHLGLGLRLTARLGQGRQAQIGPGETVDEHLGPADVQRLQDVGAGAGIGGGGQGHGRHRGEARLQPPQIAIVGPEVMPPLRDAVRFVDGDEGQVQLGQPVEQPGRGQPLGRDIQQLDLAGPDTRPEGGAGLGIERGIQSRGGHAQLVQRGDLIAHQGDERRDHQRQAGP